MILLVALTGNVGRNGGGFNHYVGPGARLAGARLLRARLPRRPRQAALPEHDALELRAFGQPRPPPVRRQADRVVHRRIGQERLDAAVARAAPGRDHQDRPQAPSLHRLARQLSQPGEGQRDHRDLALAGPRSDRGHQLPHGHDGALFRRGPAGVQLLREGGPQLDRLPQLHAHVRQGRRPAVREQDGLGCLPRPGREDRRRGEAEGASAVPRRALRVEPRLHDLAGAVDRPGRRRDRRAGRGLHPVPLEGNPGHDRTRTCRRTRSGSSPPIRNPGTATSSPASPTRRSSTSWRRRSPGERSPAASSSTSTTPGSSS